MPYQEKTWTVSCLATEDGLAPSTIKAYLSAVRHLQIAANLPDPQVGDMARLEQVIKGSNREYTWRNPPRREHLPIPRMYC